MRSGRPLALFLATVALGGCATAFDGTTYRGDGFAFRISPPSDAWDRVAVTHAALAYRAKEGDGTIAIDARCGQDGDDVPLASLTQHLFLGFTEQEVLDQKVVPFAGREALHTLVQAKLDGVPKKFDVWVLKKDGCVYDLYYIGEPARFDRGTRDFSRVVQGFATVPPHAD